MNKVKELIMQYGFLLTEIICVFVCLLLIYLLGALPMKYMMAVVGLSSFLVFISYLLVKPSKKEGKGKIKRVIGNILCILLSAAMLIGSFYVRSGSDVLDNVTAPAQKINRFTLYVLNDSSYNTFNDFTFENVGTCNMYDNEDHILEAHNALLYENSHIKIKEYSDYESMINDFYNHKIAGIYVNQAYTDMFLEVYETFINDVREIYSHEITEEIIDISKDVDVTKSTFTVYISGIDTSGKVSTVSRSDVNMLVTVNPVSKEILLTSIPRDAYITLNNKGKKDKLTHAGLAGVENSVKSLENFMGIDINYYARVNFTSLIKMVDALGGISVYSPVSFFNGIYQFDKGYNEMDGKKALAFARERYALGGGDGSRVKNQQRIIEAMLKKAMSPTIIKNFNKVLKSIDGTFETNMSSNEIMNLVSMQLNDMASWKFHTSVVSGTGKLMYGGAYMPNHKLYYLIPSDNSVKECVNLIKKITNGESLD